jgi:hypothetical protein
MPPGRAAPLGVGSLSPRLQNAATGRQRRQWRGAEKEIPARRQQVQGIRRAGNGQRDPPPGGMPPK